MLRFKHLRSLGNDRLGLAMIVASLVSITLIVGILVWDQKESREKQIRMQGVTLTRMLAGMPHEQLIPPEGQQGLLSTIFQSQNDPNFAYAAIVDTDNRLVSGATAPGIAVPPMEWPEKSTGYLAERQLVTNNGAKAIEFYTPLHADNEIAAYLRLGYFLPGTRISTEQLPFFATLALIIFLLTPLFHMMLRKEVRPLREANEKIQTAIESEQFKNVELGATDELRDFVGRFSTFIEFARNRIENLESEQEKLLASKNIVSYSKSRIENVLETIPEAVLILDLSGNITFANRRVSTLLGVEHHDVVDKDLNEWCNNPELADVISRYSSQPESSALAETVRIDVSGMRNSRKLAIKAYPLFSPTDSNTIYGSLIVFRDITKESAAERQQGDFVAHVAHELKTPLNTLALCSEALMEDDSDDSQGRIETANIMHDEVERMAALIDNLLSITKIEMGKVSIERKRLRLHDFLQDAFDVAARTDPAKELKYEIELPPDLTPIMADKDLLRVAVNNLLTNAVKYSKPGGTVNLRCEETEQTVRIIVQDDGIGIDESEQEKIFDRFYRSESAEARARSGHGLGLALVRDIVELQHGTVTVESTPGEGSEFVIEIWKDAGLLKQVI